MNALENKVHNLLRYNPKVKSSVVYLYQRLFSLIKKPEYKPEKTVRIDGFFFGFHDKSPWNSTGKLLLAHKLNSKCKYNTYANTPIPVGYLNSNHEFYAIGETKTWNWQQGATLQWVGNKDIASYHSIKNGKIVTKQFDISTKITRTIQEECACYSPCGNLYANYSFKRFGASAKGYDYKLDVGRDTDLINKSAIQVKCNQTGHKVYSVGYSVLTELSNTSLNGSISPYVSHALFSKSGSNLAFFYRWKNNNGGILTQLFIAKLDSGELLPIKIQDCSHISWIDDSRLLCYGVVDKGGYFEIDIENGTTNALRLGYPSTDGHPYIQNNLLVTDTYPNRHRQQKLYFYDLSKKDRSALLVLNANIPFRFRAENRCDFHPRLSPDSQKICIDFPSDRIRSMMIIDTPNKINSTANCVE